MLSLPPLLRLYIGALVIGAVLLPLLVLGPDLLADLLTRLPGPNLGWLIGAGYWPVASLASLVALTTLYHIAVPARTRWRRDVPGAVLALAVWIGGSVGLRLYLASGLRDAGPAAAPIAVLLFFFVTALAVLLGAELNASLDRLWPDAATEEGRRDARGDRTGGGGAVTGRAARGPARPEPAEREQAAR